MKIQLLDPGLLNRHGHHFHIDLAIYEECAARGLSVSVLGNRNVEPEIRAQLPVEPVFEASAYPSRDGTSERNLRTDFETFNCMMERDLHQSVRPDFRAEDLILVPTARDIHLSGIYRWYTTLPEPRPKICLRLLFEPWFRAKPEERDLAVELSRRQMREWAAFDREQLVLISERRELADYYEGLCGVPVTVLPMMIRYPESPARECADGGSAHIVFLGEARREKGFHLYPDAFAPVFRKYPQLRLTLQASCLFDVGPETVNGITRLSPRVATIREPLSTREYEELLVSSDVILVTYDPERYALRTSQIFLEAVGLGKVVVTTRGTWMEAYLKALGVDDVCLDSFTSDSLTAAMDGMMQSWPAVSARAREAAPASRRLHNPSSFVDGLLAAAQG